VIEGRSGDYSSEDEMADRKFALGLDFGTESGRALLVDVATGEEVATEVWEYSHGVLDRSLPDGTSLPPDWALQDPQDYIETLRQTVPAVLGASGVSADSVVGVGIDFTSCTMLPTDAEGTPLCCKDEWRSNPHAWVKLWKHHAAQPEADKINETARRRGEAWLSRYGGKYSSEWFFSKVWQILDEAPEVYEAADRMIEAADWIVWQLTGRETRNLCTAGYKAIYDKRTGFVSDEFLAELDPRLEHVIDEKMMRKVLPLGTRAGNLTPAMAELTGLRAGTPVAVGNVDAHVSVPAAGISDVGKLLMIMGTSICHMVLGRDSKPVEGMCGVVEDGILPGFFGYEAGQSGAGDILAWFVRTWTPGEIQGRSAHEYLEKQAARLKPGETGLVALDWWNGNRSILVDTHLSGLLLGATLDTTLADIYRSLIESIAFGTRMIIENFERYGIRVSELYACGGMPERNKLLMQIFADVTGRSIKLARSSQTPALGSAMFGAVAAGRRGGGYDTIYDAIARMGGVRDVTYNPDPANHAIYNELFLEYAKLHDYFGRGANDVMKRLRGLKARQRG
jgi:L-ribulokinase